MPATIAVIKPVSEALNLLLSDDDHVEKEDRSTVLLSV